jgi:hypothetical protein
MDLDLLRGADPKSIDTGQVFPESPRCHLHIEKKNNISGNKQKKKILGLVPSMYARPARASLTLALDLAQ